MGARMPRALPAPLVVALFGLTLAGCGNGGASAPLSMGQLPLIPGASVVSQERQCDRGSNAFCAIEAVIVDKQAPSSGALVASEHRKLHSLGWTTSAGDDGDEVAADSPGHKVRVTYATALSDLIGWDEKWIKRPYSDALALDREFINRTPAMSIMLEAGPT
jgi:hypothetical protein